jgi:hypothetical protein
MIENNNNNVTKQSVEPVELRSRQNIPCPKYLHDKL